METFEPVSISNPAQGIYIYDFGQNASGIISLKTTGGKGKEIRLHPSELMVRIHWLPRRHRGIRIIFLIFRN
jgi:hypothetical protein